MAKNPWVLPDGFDADVSKAIKALVAALKKSGAKIPADAYTQLRLGNIDAFLAYVDWDKIRSGFGDLEAIMAAAAMKGGTSTFKLGGVDAELLFDLIDERAVIYAQERVGQLIVEITDQMRETVRETIAAAERGEMTYQGAAIELQKTIPLTTRDAKAVTKYTEKQFSRFLRQGLSEAKARIKAQNMSAQYAAKLLESRTKTIARTEIIDASMSGRYIGWEAGVTAGYISNDSVKEWIAEPDACPICSELDGKLIGWNAEWQFPEGVTAGSSNRMPPAHPNCRCSVVILPPDYSENVFTPSSGGEMPEEASEFLKHMLGLHDQSTHARRKVAGVPENIDLDGKRWNADARREFGARFNAYEEARYAAHERLSEQLLGAKWNDLPEYGSQKIPTPEPLKGSGFDNNGFIEPSKAIARDKEFWDIANNQPEVLAAKKHLEEHFIFADAAALAATNGGTIGDMGFETSYTPLEKLTRLGGSRDGNEAFYSEYGDKALLRLTAGQNQSIYPDPNVGVKVPENINLNRSDAIAISDNDWNEFIANAEPQIIMSAGAAQKVISQGRVKTVHEVGRPARAGGNDADYLDTRRTYENVAFGYDDSTPVEKRPVSGLFGTGEPYNEFSSIYGGKNPAVITLKPETKERITYTFDDSLNGFGAPHPAINPVPPKWSSKAAEAAVYRTATGRNYYADNKISAPEIQVHGGVTLNDIAKVTFYGEPSASVLATMDRNNVPYTIETPDGRSGLSGLND